MGSKTKADYFEEFRNEIANKLVPIARDNGWCGEVDTAWSLIFPDVPLRDKDGFGLDGMDVDGYDRYGFDAYGFNRDKRNHEGLTRAEKLLKTMTTAYENAKRHTKTTDARPGCNDRGCLADVEYYARKVKEAQAGVDEERAEAEETPTVNATADSVKGNDDAKVV